jgi:hypothetical protein
MAENQRKKKQPQAERQFRTRIQVTVEVDFCIPLQQDETLMQWYATVIEDAVKCRLGLDSLINSPVDVSSKVKQSEI